MIPGSVCSETSDQHKIANVMTVDHRSMWKRTQILTYILSRQWTWATLRNVTHRTPRSPSLFHGGPVTSFHPFSSRTFPPSARKSALLASLAQNANLISQLWTTAAPVFFFARYTWPRRKEPVSRELKLFRLSVRVFFQVTKSWYVHSLCGWDWCKLLSKSADIWCWGANCRHSPQDTNDCSLKYKTLFSLILLLIRLWRKNTKGLTSFLFFGSFWEIVQ